MRRLHYNLRSQSAGGIEDFVVTADALKPHFARDGIGRVMPSDILNEVKNIGTIAKRTSVYSACGPVDFIVGVNGFQQGVDRRLFDLNSGQTRVVEFVQRAAEDGALTASARDGAL